MKTRRQDTKTAVIKRVLLSAREGGTGLEEGWVVPTETSEEAGMARGTRQTRGPFSLPLLVVHFVHFPRDMYVCGNDGGRRLCHS